MGSADLDWLENAIMQDPSLGNGVFFTTAGKMLENGKQQRDAYVIAIIDPLTGFT